MIKNTFYLVVCFILFSNFCFGQSCSPLALDSITNPGMYTVASITESNGLRNGPAYAGATVYYPTNATPPFASIVIVPGYLSPQSSIQTWGPFLASHGIVAMTIGTNSVFENPLSRRDALLDAIVSLKQENTRSASPILGNLDLNKIGVGGWSMGGGGAQLAAGMDSSLKVVMALCPWLDSQTTPADLNHNAALLIFTGEIDPTAPPAAHGNINYSYTPATTPKLIYEIDNGGHLVANSPTGAQDAVGKIGLSWLKQHLVGDTCYCPLLLDTPSTAVHYMTNVTCSPANTSINDIRESNTFSKLYPNPAKGSIQLEVQYLNQPTNYEIISLAGTRLANGLLSNHLTSIDIQQLPAGVYIMNIISPKITERIKFVVL